MLYGLIAAMGSAVTSDGGQAAGGATGGGAGMSSSLIMIVVMLAIFYFLLIRPQKKREKESKAMLAAIKKGDKVVTIGGIRGTVAQVKENTVVIKVDDNTKIEFNKGAVSSVLEKKSEPEDSKKEEKKEDKKEDKKEIKEEKTEAAAVEETPVQEVASESGEVAEKKD
ncbi:MAG: preprotein translocase subunit YajC [Sphaerochaetaceae bacterium]|nr:preprotein translocase subunit YajC [Sphaerochaetaceae bacterium]